MQFAVSHSQIIELIKDILGKLPARERNNVENTIAAVTEANLVTAVRPFMFGGRIVHELYFDPSKLLFFTMQERNGAVVSALIIAYLAHEKAKITTPLKHCDGCNLWFELQEDGTLVPLRVEHLSRFL